MEPDLPALARLLRERAIIDAQIAQLIGRPAHAGHIGEYIAAAIFDIALHESANHPGSDGVFSSGVLAGKTVNIKLYSKNAGFLDIVGSAVAADHPDIYLVMVGRRATALSSKGTSTPIAIESVHLFESDQLLATLVERGVFLGIGTSVRNVDWQAAMVYPESKHPTFTMTDEQMALVALFAPASDSQQ